MRKLTTREKTMIGFCGIMLIVVLGLFVFRPLLNQWRNAGEELKLKQTELKSNQELVTFESSAIAIEDKLRMKTGLGSSIISDEQFNQLKEQLTVDDTDDDSNKLNINKATRTELTKLGFDKYLINSILAYRYKVGQFQELEELKNIRGTIFEGQLAEAIISQRLAKIIQDAGIGRIDRLDAKLLSGKNTETISRDVKKLFVDEIYLNELETEIYVLISHPKSTSFVKSRQKMQNLEEGTGDSQDPPDTENPTQTKAPKQKDRQFEPLPDIIPDELKLDVAKAIIAHKGEIEQKFVELEGTTREEAVQLALYKLKAKEEDVDVKILDEGRKGFLGFMIPPFLKGVGGFFAKPVKVRVTKKKDEQGIIAGFKESLLEYNEELAYAFSDEEDFYYDEYYDDWDEDFRLDFAKEVEGVRNQDKDYYDEDYDSEIEESVIEDDSGEIEQVEQSEIPSIGEAFSEGEPSESSIDEIAEVEGSETPNSEESNSEGTGRPPFQPVEEDIIDEDVMAAKLAEYLVNVSQRKDELQKWLYSMPISYQKQSYVVDMAFKCEMPQLVNIMCKIESSFRWLSVRGLKISIANQKGTLLSANISVLATVL